MTFEFGEFISKKRKKLGISLREVANFLGITAAYLSDIEKSRRNPPDKDVLEKIATILELTAEEKNKMFDYAGKDRKQIAPDLPDYIMELPSARTALRKASLRGEDQ